MRALGRFCSKLEQLDILGAKKVTTSALRFVLEVSCRNAVEWLDRVPN